MEDQYVKKTLFCDHDHPSIGEMAIKLARNTDNDRQFVKNTFFFCQR